MCDDKLRRLTELDLDIEEQWLAQLPLSLRSYMQIELRGKAHVADKYRKKFRRAHPIWGVGTLWSLIAKLSSR